MEFDIIGTGSIGLLFAVKLKQARYHVNLWTSTEAHAELLEQHGVTLYHMDGEVATGLKLTSRSINSGQKNEPISTRGSICRYAIIAVKQTNLDEKFLRLLSQLASQRGYAAVIALQNGRGHIPKLSAHLQTPVLTMVTSEAAKRQNRVSIVHTGQGESWVGDELARDIDCLHQKNIVKALGKAGFAAFMSKNIKEQVYHKLIRNAVINPLTALFDVSNGQLPQLQQRLKLMEKLYEETKEVLMAEEPSLEMSSFDDILRLCSVTANNTSSMRADVLAGAVTEVAYINGAVVAIAARHELSAPLNESIVHMIEALHPEQ